MKEENYVETFLLKNGFKKQKDSSLTNLKCTVHLLEDCYKVDFDYEDGDFIGGFSMFTESCKLYHLVGILTWYDLLDRNYIK